MSQPPTLPMSMSMCAEMSSGTSKRPAAPLSRSGPAVLGHGWPFVLSKSSSAALCSSCASRSARSASSAAQTPRNGNQAYLCLVYLRREARSHARPNAELSLQGMPRSGKACCVCWAGCRGVLSGERASVPRAGRRACRRSASAPLHAGPSAAESSSKQHGRRRAHSNSTHAGALNWASLRCRNRSISPPAQRAQQAYVRLHGRCLNCAHRRTERPHRAGFNLACKRTVGWAGRRTVVNCSPVQLPRTPGRGACSSSLAACCTTRRTQRALLGQGDLPGTHACIARLQHPDPSSGHGMSKSLTNKISTDRPGRSPHVVRRAKTAQARGSEACRTRIPQRVTSTFVLPLVASSRRHSGPLTHLC